MVTPAEFFSAPNPAARPEEAATDAVIEPLLPVGIVLGMPQRNCQYHGICRIDLDDRAGEACSCRVRAGIGLRGDRLLIGFEKAKMPATTAEKHFASGYFIVLTDFTLPETVRNRLHGSFTIRRGVYPVRETATRYFVFF